MRHYRFRDRLSMFFVLAVAPLVCLATLLAPRWDKLKVKHSWEAVPDNWESLGPPPTGTTIKLRVALRPHRKNALIETLYEVSSPRHPKYGAHLSKGQVAQLVMPHPDTLELVHSWLDYHGVPPSSVSTTHGGSWLTLKGVPVSKANDLLSASYQLYRHTETNETIVRTVGYSLPEVLHIHVQTVAPTTYFASLRMFQQAPRKRSDGPTAGLVKAVSGRSVTALAVRVEEEPEYDITPAVLIYLYKTFAYVPAAMARNKLGIAGYNLEYPNPDDLRKFLDDFFDPRADAVYTVVSVNGGGYDPGKPTFEGNVDVQYADAIAYPTPIIYYITGEGPTEEDDSYLAWLDFILEQTDIPQTITTSYANFEKNYPRHLALGSRGVSVLFATGDWGVGQGDCTINSRPRFLPTFPASCPYVTSVGGTKCINPEKGMVQSGGGFSDYFERPEYQDEVVPAYLEILGNQYAGLYNPSGRGIPDVAAQAYNVIIVHRGEYEALQGTSCSTPIMAGVISLLNDFRLSEGKHALGFLNPLLYGDGREALNDITSGKNPGCKAEGFTAVDGWDPVTGLGTPDFEELQTVARTFTHSSTPTPSSIGSTTPSGVSPSTTGTPSVQPSTTGTPSAPPVPPSESPSASWHTRSASTNRLGP